MLELERNRIFGSSVLMGDYPRVSLAHLPTPLDELPRLSGALDGPRLFVKRDDQTGLATGGNKTRMLEFLVAEALQEGADVLVAYGAVQSNHVRQTAAAAAKLGLRAHCVLDGEQPSRWTGNLLLCKLLGAEIHWAGKRDRAEAIQAVVERSRSRGRCPYVIAYDQPRAAIGYVAAMEELVDQLAKRNLEIDRIVVASGGGGTQAGLIVGATALGIGGRIEGISTVFDKMVLEAKLEEMVSRTVAFLGFGASVSREDLVIHDDYLESRDGVVDPLVREAILLAAQAEGLLVDPVYSGKAMTGLIDLVRRGVFSHHESVLFWHTGGAPTLFAYAEELSR